MDYPQLNLLFGRGLMFGAQMLASLVSLVLAFGLDRSLMPVPSG